MLKKNKDSIDEYFDLADFQVFEINLVSNKWKVTENINKVFGVPKDFIWNFDSFIGLIVVEQREEIKEKLENVIKNKENEYSLLFQIQRPIDAEKRWIASKAKVICENGRATKFIGANVDMTEYKGVEEQIKEKNDLMMTFLQVVPAFVFVKEYNGRAKGTYILCNEQVEDMMEMKKEDIIGKNDFQINSKEDALYFLKTDNECMSSGEAIRSDLVIKRENDESVYYDVSLSPYSNVKNEIIGVIGVGKDISSWKQKLKKIADLRKTAENYAYIDQLTKVKNRNYFNVYYDDIAEKYGNGEAFAVLIDIDFFKVINDTFGHIIGDEVLKEIGNSINKEISESELAIRYGGDEFLLFLEGKEDSDIEKRLELLCQIINENCKKNQLLLEQCMDDISASCGYFKISNSKLLEKAVVEADREMYKKKAKRKGGG